MKNAKLRVRTSTSFYVIILHVCVCVCLCAYGQTSASVVFTVVFLEIIWDVTAYIVWIYILIPSANNHTQLTCLAIHRWHLLRNSVLGSCKTVMLLFMHMFR